MTSITALIDALDTLLQPGLWSDVAPNGVQVPASEEIRTVVTGVSASQKLLEEAADLGADLVLVHHGLFWRGQFGIADLRVEPLPRGGGFEFVDAVVGGAIPRQFIPAVEHGVREAMAQGGAHGFPVVDVKVTCFDGKYHSVDSSEMSFKMAGSLGFREALAKAEPVVLEPVSLVVVTVPNEQLGDVMGDLNARRGRVQGTEPVGEAEQEVTAMVPTSEVLRYAIDLRSLTGGRGRFRTTHDHYDVMPAHLVERLKAPANA